MCGSLVKSEVHNYHIPATYYCKTISSVDEIWTHANGVGNKLFIAFLFNDHDVGVQFL